MRNEINELKNISKTFVNERLDYDSILNKNYFKSPVPKKCIYLKYYQCRGFYKNSFMFDYFIINDVYKIEGFDKQKFLNILNVDVGSFYNYENKFKILYNLYVSSVIYMYGVLADKKFRERIEYNELNQFFIRLNEKYKDYYILNLDYILTDLLIETDCIFSDNIKRRLQVLEQQENIEKEKIKKQQEYYKKLEKERQKKLEFLEKQVCYILKDVKTNLYKIGKSINPLNREKTLQSEKPTYKLIKIFKKDHEFTLHNKYRKQRIRGEWFKSSNIQLKYICTTYD